MLSNIVSRRGFLCRSGVLGSGAFLAARSCGIAERLAASTVHVATNQYPWLMFYQRENRNFAGSLDAGLGEVAKSGIQGYEPLVTSPKEIDQLAPLLKKHGLEMRSLYVNSVLHRQEEVEKSTESILDIAGKATRIGTRIIVTNPSPIRWGGPENKDDAQLRIQAESLDKLGARLKSIGLTLAYHNHDIELRNAAREFHHMMIGTDPGNVTLCLDAHWIYRGSGNSAVALFDILRLYGRRVTELHLRQSIKNVWSESLSEGDIDYPALAKHLLSLGLKPHLVLEQAPEKETPRTMDAVEAHRNSLRYARQAFAGFAS
jgi:inosose dehydratase